MTCCNGYKIINEQLGMLGMTKVGDYVGSASALVSLSAGL